MHQQIRTVDHALLNKKSVEFCTIGYEQSSIDEFLLRLNINKIITLVDVREMPLSRKKGFSKNGLRENLNSIGVDYVHFKSLGAPKPLRDFAKSGGDWSIYTERYTELLSKNNLDIDRLIELSSFQKICLLCFERDPMFCHRSLVANRMIARSKQLYLSCNHIRY